MCSPGFSRNVPRTYAPFFFTWSAQGEMGGQGEMGVVGEAPAPVPLHITGGEGARFFTADGATWLDLGSMAYNANLGHGHPRMVAAIKAQADRLCVVLPNAIYPEKQRLAERLLEKCPPGFTKVFFTLGGSEATENALKIARLYTGRHKALSRYRSYHGATMGALSLTGDYRRPPLEPGLPGAVKALDCYCDRCPFGQKYPGCNVDCASHIRDVLALEGGIGAVFLEPVPGANGVLVPPPEYWPEVRRACDDHGALLVADEVLTGFGRTGRFFGFEHFDVVPDLITCSKGLTGGYGVLGAVLVHERVAAHFEANVLYAGLTHYAHPLGVAAALEAISVYEEEQLVARAAALSPQLRAALEALARDHAEVVRHVRGIGLLFALELDLPAARLPVLAAELQARRVHVHLRKEPRCLILAPPLCIAPEDLASGVALVGEALAAVSAGA